MKIIPFFKLIFTTLFSAVCYQASAQSLKNYTYELGFKSDNDAYLATKQDRYYTNGLFIYFRKALQNSKKQDTSTLVKKIWSLNIGQKMFTARSGKTQFIENVDRPITAYLYASTALQWHFKTETFIKAELQLGTIGPSALGKQTQEFIHTTLNFYKINGWQFQLNNAFGINLKTNYQRLLYRSQNKKTDFALPLTLNVGSTFTGASAGLLFRIGNINPFYQSIAAESTVTVSTLSYKVKAQEFYFYAKPIINLVVYDATIQGGMFKSHQNEVVYQPVSWVFRSEVGIGYSKNRISLHASVIFKTPEIKSTASSHKYGMVAMLFRFN
ncbi:MAG: lipid A deacylase LpxR family protein [Sphingobacteriales bacterium]|nr:MAG: lipid A deacylase LpxR family protein [Sphingobacteriales bacterium]